MNAAVKRAGDVLVAAGCLALLSPVLGLVSLAILIAMSRPVLFRQVRPGLHGRPFTMIKFRTMSEERDPEGNLLPDAERMTRLGRLLRSSSLDELPELFNVLKGDMSLVGPRPLRMEYLPLYTPEQARRHNVKPGITGWAQVNGRNAVSWSQRLAMDVWYVEHTSLLLDLRIILMTTWAVVTRRGISAEGHATMPKFTGTE